MSSPTYGTISYPWPTNSLLIDCPKTFQIALWEYSPARNAHVWWWRISSVYSANQCRVATVKYLGELYIYCLISSGLIFDTFWVFITFGHCK